MSLFKEVKSLIRKDIVLEWRSKYAINGIVLYVVSTVFVCYQAFKSVDPTTWNALFWIILLFASVNAINKSFVQESRSRQFYYYTIASAKAIILSKIVYNMLMMLLLSSIAYLVYSIIFSTPLGDPILYLIAVSLGGIGFAAVFTMVSAISAKAGNNSTLMAILSFPIIIPLLLVLIKVSKNAMDGLERSISYDELTVLAAINILTVAISLLLFPYLWRD
ncbi:cytochrome C biogenesis protein CcmB [Parapedobacter pyrenivorans]|uniref:Cytochrome C biogenesis protein CcmB n=1 Tax=Parapedobacter pyrenivorans TaxID=1305674 RepID=A0A917I2K9_9SPHI|nr:heme exporter protein CcmB [Parapedobacter pyrenivorans]GGH03396.1 cytochrome C biogenesis protein CcmB [Parapedobacter pyrenivorans]